MKPATRTPDFRNLAEVLERREPSRPTLFEFFLNNRLYEKLAGKDFQARGLLPSTRTMVLAHERAGYDYATVPYNDFCFVEAEDPKQRGGAQSVSLNEGALVTTRADFDAFEWPDPAESGSEEFDRIREYLPEGMKIIPFDSGGVLENITALVGYDNLCTMIYDNEQLVYDIFETVGSRILENWCMAMEHDFVGAIIVGDDWGFNTQTMLSPKDMRRFVFPWHKEIVKLAHSKGLYAILHSCGYYREVVDDVIDDIRYDARHSYEDNVVSVEEAYEELHTRIAVLGGIDVDFMARKSPGEVFARSRAMIERSSGRGAYALGTGNSVPEFIPDQNYFAMTEAAWSEMSQHGRSQA